MTHFHSKYKVEFKGARSYSWLKTVLQGAWVVKTSKRRGKHRIKRERAPLPGMMLHQDASTHRWVANAVWDLVVTMDDATSEHTSMFFCEQEGPSVTFTGPSVTIPESPVTFTGIRKLVKQEFYASLLTHAAECC